ncbi:protein Wnt-7b isoform X2 [Cimex lectularius]|uniref:Protein Wnt n=1 Tax=Cimex lectularius TaxID=79782 RepID=A0A8I6TJV6_CIMLE|nr:protein Wnt-7b isoform X2 [Cimex lectularius]XP_014257244.1 protein Wnt-7b isoform X2 [Cimex lectularius]
MYNNDIEVCCVGFGAELVCSYTSGLSPRQRELCKSAPEAFLALAQGLKLGLAECQYQFRYHRWNCSTVAKGRSFGQIVILGSREAALTYGMVSAGAVYAIAASCSRGNISECGCKTEKRSPQEKWKWGGCSVDVSYGMKFARRFLDAREFEKDARSYMNLHNNKAGRLAVKGSMGLGCKCHGVSGSCSMKTCWRTLPQFRKVADYLVKKYRRARSVRWNVWSDLRTKKTKVKPKSRELVFLEPSPNYCERDYDADSLGTHGRNCFTRFSGPGSCDLLCCGRGYNTRLRTRVWRCNCKFHWCCHVTCDTCTETKEVHTCN